MKRFGVSVWITERYGGALQKISVKCPVTVNKFIEATDMDGQMFFARWKALSQ